MCFLLNDFKLRGFRQLNGRGDAQEEPSMRVDCRVRHHDAR